MTSNATSSTRKNNANIIFITTTALMTAVICILGPLSIPIGPVPISLTNLAIYFTMYILDTKRGTIAYLIYLLLGLVGLPVFSGFSAGPQKLFGPTGGYLIGFIPMALVIGLIVDRFYKKRVLCVIAMEAATWICYLLGTAWLMFSAQMSFKAALFAGVIPFIVEDLIKMIIAAIAGPVLRDRLRRFTSLTA
ncbi:MAG: biotin transporter BioY [Lachnospiraceae bacterium]|nr:biotin transporter BioY [Lachnospiraceae bacterium]MDY6352736.1 biotin transporter BioY [Lachnospiraceae bacterium]